MKKALALFLTLVMLFSTFAGLGTMAFAVTETDGIWVDPVNGNDANSGAYGSPLKTLEAAKTKAVAASAADDVTVWMMDGTYWLDETLTFSAEESGQNGHTITFKAAEGAAPVISGGKPVTGWSVYDEEKNIYVADVPEGGTYSRQFYVDGEHQTRAMTEVSPTDWTLFGAKGYVSPASNSQNTAQYLTLDLGEVRSVNYLTVYPCNETDRNGFAAGFPQDFTIEVSENGTDWTVVCTETGHAAPATGKPVQFDFSAVNARYVKLNVTKLGTADRLNPGKYTLSVSELETGLDAGNTAYDFTKLTIDYSENLMDELVAIGYTADPTWNDLATYPAENLFDGNADTFVKTGVFWNQWLVGHDESGTCDPFITANVSKNGESVEIAAVNVTVAEKYQPTDFTLEVTESANPTADDWTVIAEMEDFSWDSGRSVTFIFEPTMAKQVRLHASTLTKGDYIGEGTRSDDGYHYSLALAEFAAYPAAAKSTEPVEIDYDNDLLKPGCVVGIFHNSPKYESFNYDEAGTFPLDYLVDGKAYTFITSKSYGDVNQLVGRGGTDTPWVEVKVSEDKPVTVGAVRVTVRPRVVPSSFMIQASADGVTWSTVVDETDYDWSTENTVATFTFDPVQATRLRFVCRDLEKIVEDEGWYFQLAEMQAFSVKQSEPEEIDYSTNLFAGATEENLVFLGYTSLSKGTDTESVHGGTPKANLFDGNYWTMVSSGGFWREWLSGAGGDLQIKLQAKISDTAVKLGAVKLIPRQGSTVGRPIDFTVQTSADGATWKTVATYTDYDWSAEDAGLITFTPVNARQIRLLVDMIADGEWNESRSDYDYFLQLGELEAYGVKTEVEYDDSVNLMDALEVYGHNENRAYEDISAPVDGSRLLDNDLSTTISTGGYWEEWLVGYGGGIAPWISMNVSKNGESVYVSAVRLAVDTFDQCTSFTIEVTQDDTSENDGNWIVVHKEENFDWSESRDVVFTFQPQLAKKVRLRATKIEVPNVVDTEGDRAGKATYRLRVAELAAYAPVGTAADAGDYTTNLLADATGDNVLFIGYTSMSKGTDTEHRHGGTPVSNLFDGSTGTFLSTAGFQYGWLTGAGGDLQIKLQVKLSDTPVQVGAVRMTPRDNGVGRPTDFSIQTSADGTNWQTVATLSDYDWTADNAGFITFNAVDATQIRFLIDMTENPESENYYFQIAGLAAYPGAAGSDDDNVVLDSRIVYITAEEAQSYDVAGIEALNESDDFTYAAEQAINGMYYEDLERWGYYAPESYDLKNFKNTSDMEIHIQRWWYHRILKNGGLSEDGTAFYLDEQWLSSYQQESFADRISWLENAYEFIDQPGEWWIDRENSKIYYKPDGTMTGKTAIVPVIEQLIVFEGCQNITFDGVKFEDTSWLLPNELGYIDAQSGTFVQHSGTWGDVPGAIEMHAASNIKITNSEICNVGSGGIRIGNGSTNCEITNSAIHDTSSSGIWVGNNTGHNHGSCEPGTDVTDILIRNNYVTRTGIDIFDSSAICVLYSSNTVIDHNEVCNTSYTGISLGWGWDWKNAPCSGNNTVSNNYIHDTGKTVHDGGNFYSLGLQNGTKVYGNYVHHHSDGKYDKDGGLYTDEGTTGMELYNNVVGDGVYWWRKLWKYNIQDCYWHDNFYSVNRDWNDGTNITSENNTWVEDGDFSKYPAAQAIIDNAGLLDESVKQGVREGVASKHDVMMVKYPDCEAYYFGEPDGLLTFSIPGQIGNTQYNKLYRTVAIVMPEGTDLTALAAEYTALDGFTCDKASGSVQDFSGTVVYTFTNGTKSFDWTVKVTCEVTTSGEPTGTEMTLDEIITNTADWTQPPTIDADGSAVFSAAKGFSTYIGSRISNDTILEFDMSIPLDGNDWTGYSLRMQDPNATLGTMYHIVIKQDVVELQKWIDGNRTMLIGTIEGYPSAFGDITNDYFTTGERHSIKTGAIDVPTGVRLFMYVDGNKVFDVIDADDPITEDGFFAVYPMTHPVTLYSFSDIQNVTVDFTALDAAIGQAEAINPDNYTKKSYEALKTALDAAKEIRSKEDATQVEVNAALNDLNAALEALVEKSGEQVFKITGPVGTVYPYTDSVKSYLTKTTGTVWDYYQVGSEQTGDASIAPVTITWSDVDDTTATKYVVEYATKADYSDAITVVKDTDLDELQIEVYNLYKAATYYVRVTAYAGETSLGSVTSTFETTDLGARIMNIDSLYNVRDVGGYKTESGKTTKQGMIYRGSEMNGEHGIKLSETGNRYMSEVLGIKFDMDLRADNSETPLSSATKKSYGINGYEYAFTETEKYRSIFADLADESNYPIYVHCWGGADRTGTVVFLLNALLGVSEEELIQDFELTSWSIFGIRYSTSDDFTKFITQLNTYDGETLCEKTENYLLSIGVTAEQIASIREIMLGEDETVDPDPTPTPTPDTPAKPTPKPNNPAPAPVVTPTEQEWQNPYTDVSKSDSYYEAVKYVTENGIMNGTGKGTFSPDRSLTRGMMVTVLYRMEGSPAVTAENPFTDLTQDWYKKAVVWAADKGIVNGVGGTNFAPDRELTNEQLMTILYRYAEWKGYDVSKSASLDRFTDAAGVSAWAVPAMKWAAAMSFVSGSKLNATAAATRADIARTLMLFCKAYAK